MIGLTSGLLTVVGELTRSCGCLVKGRAPRHGHAMGGRVTPEYISWRAMHQRCYDRNAKGYERYGGRGVQVAERWKNFDAFFADMGPRPKGTTIDRIDNSKGYEPGNCRWATSAEQTRNRSYTRMIRIGDAMLTVPECAELAGVAEETIRRRLGKGVSGMALLDPPSSGWRWSEAQRLRGDAEAARRPSRGRR